MSREQWGHGYWKGVEDAQAGKVRAQFPTEVKFWIAHMCASNYRKDYDRSLFAVSDWIRFARFCGMGETYAKRIYDFILRHEFYEFEPDRQSWCYVSGSARSNWVDDYFVVPWSDYELPEWEKIIDGMQKTFSESYKQEGI